MYMRALLFIFFLYLVTIVKAQENKFHVGISVGKETFIGLPHLSYYRFTKAAPNRESFFYGAHGSLFIMQTTMFATGITGGYKHGLLTLENSVSFWQENLANHNSGKQKIYHHIATNPKLGLNYKHFWIKAGPSFILYKNYSFDNALRKNFSLGNNTGYNIHISCNILNTKLSQSYGHLLRSTLDFYEKIFTGKVKKD